MGTDVLQNKEGISVFWFVCLGQVGTSISGFPRVIENVFINFSDVQRIFHRERRKCAILGRFDLLHDVGYVTCT